MADGVNLQEITELRKFGNTILTFSNIKQIVDKSFAEIEKKLSPQVISIFLFSKNGRIKREYMYGKDREGNLLKESWLHPEEYEPGQSFSGKAAAGDPYGEPYYSNNLDREIDSFSRGKDYQEQLGFLKCGISVPLNGTRRTFGTMEVINKVNPQTGKADCDLVFSESDVCWLTVVGSHVAAAISRLRKKEEDKIFATISRVLADPQLEKKPVHSVQESVYETIAKQLVKDLTPYKACIVRLTFDGKSLIVTDKAHADGNEGWKNRFDEPRRIGEGIVGKVFASGKYEKVENIAERKGEFTNLDWIESQNLKSFICFPLLILGKVIGTISLFTGYIHKFSDSDLEFLENVSFLLAAFRVRSEKVKDIDILRDISDDSLVENNLKSDSVRAGSEIKVTELLRDLSSTDDSVRAKAAIALGKIGNENVISALCNVLARDPNPEVRRSAAEALGMFGSRKTETALTKIDEEDEKNVVETLHNISEKDENSEVRRSAEETLRAIETLRAKGSENIARQKTSGEQKP